VNRTTFLTEFLQSPFSIGALAPSSPHLAKTIVENTGLADAGVVLEYGAGTGGLTEYILRELNPRAKFAAIEINLQFAAIFKQRHPGIPLFEDSVENVRAICEAMQVAAVDCVVSGLPWAFFSKSLQTSILDQLMHVLKPGGVFTTFGYLQSFALPAAWNFATLLPNYFSFVSRSSIVWRNVPPAFVYRCRR
jgi:phosphatidylethanolamine/phosphatidyl-N-methylethanolamine N-methyltransferase